MFGTLYVMPYYLDARHVPSALAGLRLASLPFALGIAAPLAGRAAGRVSARALGCVGLALAAAGLFVLAAGEAGAGLVGGLTLTGAGLGVFMPVNNASVMASAPRAHAGSLSGVLNTTRGIGTALGITLAGLLYSAGAHAAAPHPQLAPARGLDTTVAVLGAIAACTAALAAGGFSPAARRRSASMLGALRRLRLGATGAAADARRTARSAACPGAAGRGRSVGDGPAPGPGVHQPRAGAEQQHRAQHPAQRGRFEARRTSGPRRRSRT